MSLYITLTIKHIPVVYYFNLFLTAPASVSSSSLEEELSVNPLSISPSSRLSTSSSSFGTSFRAFFAYECTKYIGCTYTYICVHSVCICMHVCMYVCMYACVYACVYEREGFSAVLYYHINYICVQRPG